jgi:hypothetical protein
MTGIRARDSEPVGEPDGHRVVVENTAEPVRARAAEVAVSSGDRHPQFHSDVGCR